MGRVIARQMVRAGLEAEAERARLERELAELEWEASVGDEATRNEQAEARVMVEHILNRLEKERAKVSKRDEGLGLAADAHGLRMLAAGRARGQTRGYRRNCRPAPPSGRQPSG